MFMLQWTGRSSCVNMDAKGSDIRQRHQKSPRIITTVNGHGRKFKDESLNTSAGTLTSFANILSVLVGVLCMLTAGYKHAWLQCMLQETMLWFSNIQVSICRGRERENVMWTTVTTVKRNYVYPCQ